MPLIRIVRPQDSKAILDIYTPYIEQTSYTFEIETPSIESFAERIQSNLINYPWLVCEIDGVIAGYAYATRHRERLGYQWSVESSVYIHDDHHRKGIAQALYSALFEILKRQGFNNIYAVINLPNEKSVIFHESCGFEYFTTYENVGYKLGRWKNVGWWKLKVNEYIDEPPLPIPFARLNKDFMNELFSEREKQIKP